MKKTYIVTTWAGGLALLAMVCLLVMLAGCEQPQAGVTYSKDVNVWPFYTIKKWEGIDPNDNTRWNKEKGDCCLLGSWEKWNKFDQENFLIARKERSTFFPVYSTEVDEDQTKITKKGIIVVFPYESFRDKTVEVKK